MRLLLVLWALLLVGSEGDAPRTDSRADSRDIDSRDIWGRDMDSSDSLQGGGDRRLQFENMFENDPGQRKSKGGKGGKGGGGGGAGGAGGKRKKVSPKQARGQALVKAVQEITFESDRYHMWWTGPLHENLFHPVSWAAPHSPTSDAIFTMAVIQGHNDSTVCSSPKDLTLFLGTARRVHEGDIVIALEADERGSITAEIKAILHHHRAVVYLLPPSLCSKATDSIFCGSEEERVPASVFRFNFYEKWALLYAEKSRILIADFRDVIFQANPFSYRVGDWSADYQLAVFQEFHPNMVIDRCHFNRRVMEECFGAAALASLGGRIIVSSGALLGTRNGILVWSHHMTMQLQDAPGRQMENRCVSGGIDHGFINWLVYGQKLRNLLRIRIYAHGEGAVNSLGGLQPDTVKAHISGPLGGFWGLLREGVVLNWDGEIAPVVHQLDHFIDELKGIAMGYIRGNVTRSGGVGGGGGGGSDTSKSVKVFGSDLAARYRGRGGVSNGGGGSGGVDSGRHDVAWQALAASQCLFDCTDSVDFAAMGVGAGAGAGAGTGTVTGTAAAPPP
ncbi:hypothetical protein B484DRAFT_188281 [Ochromonadaceae sp. CCMP2298]|nr:hypothetical protein B484DRAFT_188281 [Ochromonadaceae sp. CCMP2298]